MTKRISLILIEILAFGMLLIAGALFWVSTYIDTEGFRTKFTSAIESAVGREVTLGGELDISLWPDLALEVHDLTIEEAQEFGDVPFIHFDRVLISARIIPLFSEVLDIDSIVVEKMELNLIQSADGRFNWDSMLQTNKAPIDQDASQFSFNKVHLHGVEVINASVHFIDGNENGYVLSGINMRTGAIESGADVPFTVNSNFSWEGAGIEADLILKGMLETNYDESGVSLKDATVYASFGGEFLPEGASPGELTARLVMDWEKQSVALDGLRVRFLGLRGEGNLHTGNLSKNFNAKGHVTIHPFNPSEIITRYNPNAPVKSVNGLKSSSFTSFFDINEKGLTLREMALALDDITVRGLLGFQGYSNPVFNFGLRANTIDLDRYLPLFRTGTPFIWDDFSLGLFKLFQGNGAVRADGLMILDTLISDIRLAVKADTDAIMIDAGAIKKGQASLGGKASLSIGESESAGVPTLAISTQLTAESDDDGFAFLDNDDFSVKGKGVLKLSAKLPFMECPPQERSINILDNLQTNIVLTQEAGGVLFKKVKAQGYYLDYANAEFALSSTSKKSNSEGFFDYSLATKVRTKGGDNIGDISLNAHGTVTAGIDTVNFKSPAMKVKGHVSSGLLPDRAKRINVSGVTSFDSSVDQLSISDIFVGVLDSRLRGSAEISDLKGSPKAVGSIKLVHANPKRIIYLLTGKEHKTADVEALKSVELSSEYIADKNGFTLSELKGNIDGMSVAGHVVGQGLMNPMLSFSVVTGDMDIDRYLPPKREVTLEEKRSGKVKKAPPVDLPLGFLRWLRLNGKAHLQSLKLAKIKVKRVEGNIKADAGSIHLSDITGALQGGKVNADWTGDIGERSLKTHLKLHVEDMQVGPLLMTLAERDYVRGETDVDFDLSSVGTTDDDIVRFLEGKAWARVSNGSFKFSGYKKKPASPNGNVRNYKQKKRPPARTVFRKAMGYFTVNKGVFKVDKFRVEAPPLLQSYGEGSFSLPDNMINLSIRNDFVAVPSVTIRMVGRLSDPEVRIPKGKIVDDTVRNILSLPEKSFNFIRDLF